MKYLIKTTEVYRADKESEAQELVAEAKDSCVFELAKYTIEKKEITEKKEIVGEYYKVSMTKVFNDDIKAPCMPASVNYEVQ